MTYRRGGVGGACPAPQIWPGFELVAGHAGERRACDQSGIEGETSPVQIAWSALRRKPSGSPAVKAAGFHQRRSGAVCEELGNPLISIRALTAVGIPSRTAFDRHAGIGTVGKEKVGSPIIDSKDYKDSLVGGPSVLRTPLVRRSTVAFMRQ